MTSFSLDPTLWCPIGQFWTWVMADHEIQNLHSKFCQLDVKRTRFQNWKKKRKWFFDHSTTLTSYRKVSWGWEHLITWNGPMMGHLNSFSPSGGGEFDQKFSKNSNARGGCWSFDLTGTLVACLVFVKHVAAIFFVPSIVKMFLFGQITHINVIQSCFFCYRMCCHRFSCSWSSCHQNVRTRPAGSHFEFNFRS